MALPEEFLRGIAQIAGSGELDPREASEVEDPALRERDSAGRPSRVSPRRSEDLARKSKNASAQTGEEIGEVGQNPGYGNSDVESPGLHGVSPFSPGQA